MSYQTEFVADFQSHRTGLTIHAQYYDNTGAASGAPITSGIVETASGIYRYLATISDGFVGSIVLYNSADSNVRVAFSINPNELENSDEKTSTRASQISVDTIDTIVNSIILDTNELQSDWTDGGRLDLIIDAIKAVTDVLPDNGALTTLLNNVVSILADTNELQVDWVNGGRLDDILDARASQTSVDTANTKLDNLTIAITTIDDFLDTEIADIKTKVDNLPVDPASASTIATSFSNLTAKLRKYTQLLARKDSAITSDNSTEVSEINADGGSGAGTFNNTTDSVEAIRDRGDASWITANVSGLASQSSIDIIDGIVDNILVDTNELQTDLTNGGRIDNLIDSIKAVTDQLPNGGALTTLLNNVVSILADTNELQVDWQNGGRLDNILDSRASQTSVDDLNTLLLTGITIDSATITNIAKAVLKLDASVIEDDLDAGQISLLTLVLGLLNSTLPEGGPWTIYKVGGGIYITRDIDEASAFTSVVGVHS